MRWIFSIVDLLIVNLVFVFTIFLDYRVKAAEGGFTTRPMWLALNVAMLVCIYFYNDVHEKRVIYAERVVGRAVNLVLTHAGIFITLTSLLRQPDVPWEKVMEIAAERYERLVALGKEGRLKDKRKRML